MRNLRSYAPGLDFHIYWAAVQVGLRHGWNRLYDGRLIAAREAAVRSPFGGPPHGYMVLPFYNPPPEAWLVAPLTALSYPVALAVWWVALAAALSGALLWAVPGRLRSRLTVLAIVWPLWFGPLIGLYVGQAVVLVAAAVLVTWRLLRERHDVAAGAVLSAALLKPHPVLLLPLVLLLTGRRRAFLAWAVATASLALLSLAAIGVSGAEHYLAVVRADRNPFDTTLTLAGAAGGGATGEAASLAAAVGSLWVAWRLRDGPLEALLGVGLLGSLLVVPYLHAADLVLLVVAGVMAWSVRGERAWAPFAAGWLVLSPAATLLLRARQLEPLLLVVEAGGIAWLAASTRAGAPEPGRRLRAPIAGG